MTKMKVSKSETKKPAVKKATARKPLQDKGSSGWGENILGAIKGGIIPKKRNWRKIALKNLTRGERICRFIEEYLIVPEGRFVGKPFKLLDFQVAFILAIYDSPTPVRFAALSMARKNGKTALIAALLCAHLFGPEAKKNSRLNSGALTRDQASEVFGLAAKMIALSPTLSEICDVSPSLKRLAGLRMGTEYRALSADAKTNHGGSPIFLILDEVGQIVGAQSDFVDTVTTAQGAHDDPLTIYISTQSANDSDFFSILIDDVITSQPKNFVLHLYVASSLDCDVMDEKEWERANPALGVAISREELRAAAEKAERLPSFRNTFKNLHLNLRVAQRDSYVDPQIWRENGGTPRPLAECEEIYCGLDLSSKNDLTAFVVVGVDEEKVHHCYAKFWTRREGLIDRERIDKAPYSVWEREGWLSVVEGGVVDYSFVAQEIISFFDEQECLPTKIAFDRWRIEFFKKELESLGVDLPLEPYGQGFRSMGKALDDLDDVLTLRNLRHGENPILTMCAMNSIAVSDPAGNRKLEKKRSSGRMDGMVALAMAVGVQTEIEKKEDKKLSKKELDAWLLVPGISI